MASNDARPSPALTGTSLRRAIREAVAPVLNLDGYRLFIFGSEATGLANRRSDIDIGILGPQRAPGAVVQQVRERLEGLRTLRRFDVVDLGAVDEAFKTEALRHAEPL